VVIASHDLAEVEMLADWIGYLDAGRCLISEPMESLQSRFRHVDVQLAPGGTPTAAFPDEWLDVERAGDRLSFMASNAGADFESEVLRPRFPDAVHWEVRRASLRELFVALARQSRARGRTEVAA
jgi:ABC-2 type transport system ATP-binding protein